MIFRAVSLAWLAVMGSASPIGATSDTAARVLRWTVTVENPSGVTAADAWVRVGMPVIATAHQRLANISADVASVIEVDESGSKLLKLNIGAFPAYASRTVTIEARVDLSATPMLESSADEIYLRASPLVASDSEKIRRIAKDLRRHDAIDTASATFDWVSTSLERGSYESASLGSLVALERRRGDCTEFSYLAAALLRANGVPARVVSGFTAERDRVLKVREYHDWLQFHDGRGWRSMDAHLGRFVDKAWTHVVFSVRNEYSDAVRFSTSEGLKLSFE